LFKFFQLSFILIISLFIYNACNDDPSSIGSNLIPSNENVTFFELDSYKANLTQSSSSFDKKLIFGNSDRVLLGKYSYGEASALYRFSLFLPDTTYTKILNGQFQIEKAWMQLKPVYTHGNKTSNFDFSVHQIRSTWNVTGFDRDSIASLKYDAGNVGSVFSNTDSLIQFNINNNVILEWLKFSKDSTSAPKNYGLMLKPTNSTNKLLGFNSVITTNNSTDNVLFYVVKRGTAKDTIALSPFLNNFTYTSANPIQNTNMYLEGIYSRKGQLFFNISSLPKTIIVNKATVELTVDTLNSFYGKPIKDSLFVQLLADSTTRKLTSDSTSYTILSRSGNKYIGDVTYPVQRWVTGMANHGFILSLWDEYSSPSRVTIYGSKNSDKALRPKLKIIYMQKL
jgi:hypothetical protein